MLKAAVPGWNSHDREGFGTAESTKSFAIMKCGDDGRSGHAPGVLWLSFAPWQHHALRVAAAFGQFSPLNVEYSVYMKEKYLLGYQILRIDHFLHANSLLGG